MRNQATPEIELLAMIVVVEAFNTAEAAGVSMNRETPAGHVGGAPGGLRHEFETGRYTIEWESTSERWTLVSETDDAIDVCRFNQRKAECSGIDPCEQCNQTIWAQ
jgi:hypothetical protein